MRKTEGILWKCGLSQISKDYLEISKLGLLWDVF